MTNISPNLSLVERETIVIFNESEKTACVYSTNPTITKRLKGFAEQFDNITLVKEDEYGADFIMPKSLISFRKPSTMSDEQRQIASERMKQFRNKQLQGSKDPT